MKEYRASTMITATPERIWAILIDGAAYPEWEPNTIRIDGRIGPGEQLTAFSKLSPGRAFPVTVTQFVPGQKMTWTGGMPLGLFTGERSFVLVPRDDGATEFTLREVFTGPLVGLLGRSLPDLNAAFAEFAASLKARAEHIT
jgi:hypothetical protein